MLAFDPGNRSLFSGAWTVERTITCHPVTRESTHFPFRTNRSHGHNCDETFQSEQLRQPLDILDAQSKTVCGTQAALLVLSFERQRLAPLVRSRSKLLTRRLKQRRPWLEAWSQATERRRALG